MPIRRSEYRTNPFFFDWLKRKVKKKISELTVGSMNGSRLKNMKNLSAKLIFLFANLRKTLET